MEAQMDVNEGVQRFKVFPLLLAFAVPSAKVFFFITKVKHRRKWRGCTQFDIPSLKLIWHLKRDAWKTTLRSFLLGWPYFQGLS